MIDRKAIIEKLEEKLEPLSYIYALWLEGADALGTVDQYSDMDIWVDFEDQYEQQAIEIVENVLQSLAPFDLNEELAHSHPKIRQKVYHLSGTDKYLMIDFCWQFHSRNESERTLIKGCMIEPAKMIFDKTGAIKFKPFLISEFTEGNDAILKDSLFRYSQHDRVLKYVYRSNYLEAYAYYNRYILEPLINLLRLIYTPSHADYYLIHISRHIPEQERKRLEYFAKISSFEDITEKIKPAEIWISELLDRVNALRI